MKDDKRLIRKLKRDVKKRGNKSRRRFLQDLEADPEDFDYGAQSSAAMNESARAKNSRKRKSS